MLEKERITEAFSQFTFLNPKDLLQIAGIAKVKLIKKDEQVVKPGDLNYNVMVVVRGLFRHYVIDEQGVDRTLLFVAEKHGTASMDTIFHNKPASEHIMALENSIVVKFDYRAFEKLASNNIRLLQVHTQELKDVISANVEHIKILNLLVPEERYSSFCKKHPDLEQRIKQKYIASYLGITPTSLSRIKARMVQR